MKQDSVCGSPSDHGIDLELEVDTDIIFCRKACSSHQECELQPPLKSTKKKKAMFSNIPFPYTIQIEQFA